MDDWRIDDIPPDKMARLIGELEQRGFQSSLKGLYWLPVPEHMLSELQKEHAAECGPYAMALDMEKSSISMEFLVRARYKISCRCIAPAEQPCMDHMRGFLADLLAKAGVWA